MKFWLVLAGVLGGLWLTVKLANERFNGMAYWIGSLIIGVVAALSHTAGFKDGAQAIEKGWVVRKEDGLLYATAENPGVKVVMEEPIH